MKQEGPQQDTYTRQSSRLDQQKVEGQQQVLARVRVRRCQGNALRRVTFYSGSSHSYAVCLSHCSLFLSIYILFFRLLSLSPLVFIISLFRRVPLRATFL